MSNIINQLNPNAIWINFANLNAVPRASKKEDRVIQFIKDFGKQLGLETFEDEVRNVIIRKQASIGMEDRKPIILQSHLDMVHQKNADVDFDFDKDGINIFIDGDWVRANGTTLGADNGIGVATIMAILESKEIKHPALEALFTIDEETGMTGALGLKGGILKGEILLNLDTENDSEIDIGCAGGIDVTANGTYLQVQTPEKMEGYILNVKGLNGGHSGMDIHKGLGNANKIMNRLLFALSNHHTIGIAKLNGGSLRNAIPRESSCCFALSTSQTSEMKQTLSKVINEIKFDYKTIDPNLIIELVSTEAPTVIMDIDDQSRFLKTIYSLHNGVFRMSPDIKDLVETSNNVAKITLENGNIQVACLTRSSVEASKMDLVNALKSTFELGGFVVTTGGSYPGWSPNIDSPILKVLTNIYERMYNEKPNVVACHAGLECGILGTYYPNMDMISFGPTILGAHSPDERVSITSVQKFWEYLKEILKEIPLKK